MILDEEYVCDICGSCGQWDNNWDWYGSWLDFDNGNFSNIKVFCSDECKDKFIPPPEDQQINIKEPKVKKISHIQYLKALRIVEQYESQ